MSTLGDHHKSNNQAKLSGSRKEERVVYPYTGTTLDPTATRTCRIRLPQEDGLYLNGKDTVFYATFTTAGTNEASHPFEFQSVIQQMRILADGKELQNLQDFNIYEVNRLNAQTSHSYKQGAGFILNRYDLTEANNQNLGAHRVAMQMPRSVLYQDVFPLGCSSIEIEFTIINDADLIMTSDSADATLSISDIEIHCSCLMGEELDKEYSGEVAWDFVDYHSTQHTIANAATSAQLSFPVQHKSLRSVRTFQYSTAVLADSSTYAKILGKVFNASTSYQFQIAGKNFPANRVDCTSGTEPLVHMLESYDVRLHDYDSYPGDVGDATTDLALCYDFRGDKEAISGLLAESIGNSSMRFDWQGTAAQATTCYIQSEFDRVLIKSSNGQLSVIE